MGRDEPSNEKASDEGEKDGNEARVFQHEKCAKGHPNEGQQRQWDAGDPWSSSLSFHLFHNEETLLLMVDTALHHGQEPLGSKEGS